MRSSFKVVCKCNVLAQLEGTDRFHYSSWREVKFIKKYKNDFLKYSVRFSFKSRMPSIVQAVAVLSFIYTYFHLTAFLAYFVYILSRLFIYFR